MLAGTHMTIHGLDNGYIVQAQYATILFVIFYKIQNYISYNKLIFFVDKISFSFYLLHNGIGWTLLQLFYYCLLPGHAYMSMFLAVIFDILIITAYDQIVQKNIDFQLKKYLNIISLKLYGNS